MVGETVSEARRRTPVLADSETRKLADMGRRVEALYGGPQDIEWALYEG
jgi:pyruvate,water dikinase